MISIHGHCSHVLKVESNLAPIETFSYVGTKLEKRMCYGNSQPVCPSWWFLCWTWRHQPIAK